MKPRSGRSAKPCLEPLEPRALLAPAAVPLGVHDAPAVQVDPLADKGDLGKFKIKQTNTFIRGTVIPARLWDGGKGKGALLVAGDTAWFLDLSETKGFSQWGKTLSHRQVTATGTAEIKGDGKGGIKRTFTVTWIEPLKLDHSPRLLADRSRVGRLRDLPPEKK